jgi:integrase
MSVRQEQRRDKETGELRTYWRVDVKVRHPDGRVQRVTRVPAVETKRAAERYEYRLREAIIDGTFDEQTAPPAEAPAFDVFADQWFRTQPQAAGNRLSTIEEKERNLRLHLKPFFGCTPLDEVKGKCVAEFLAVLRTKGLAQQTIKNIRKTLRTMLASAYEWEIIPREPPLPKVKVDEVEWDFFDRDESARLLAATRHPEERALLVFALHTGARAGEQLAIEWGDIDWVKQEIAIRRADAKGRVGPTKTGRRRSVPMTATLEAALREIRHLRGPLVFCTGDHFPSIRGRGSKIHAVPDGTRLTRDVLHNRLEGTCRRAGLRKIRWHDLRHSAASQLAAAGVPLTTIKEWLGHSSITLTARYAHHAPSSGPAMIRVLDETPSNPGGLEESCE